MKLLQNKKYITLHILTIFIILIFSHSYATASVNTCPTQGWQISTPEEQGMRSQMLAEMMEHIKKSSFNIDSILIVRHGYVFWMRTFIHIQRDKSTLFIRVQKALCRH